MNCYNSLYSWQKDIFDKYSNHSKWGWFLDMGLGKTKISIALSEVYQNDLIVIVTIKSKLIEYEKEGGFASELALSGKPAIYGDKLKRVKYFESYTTDILSQSIPHGIIINYEWIKNDDHYLFLINLLSKYKNVSFVFDESHKLKNRTNQAFKRFYALLYHPVFKLKYNDSVKNIYLFTGTPFSLGYEDIYAQLKLLGCPLKWKEFKDSFLIQEKISEDPSDWRKKIIGYNEESLFSLISDYSIGLKAEAFNPHLPKTWFKYIEVEKDVSYDQMSNPKSPTFKVLGDYLCDTSALFFLRLRQLASGFMGRKESYDHYSFNKMNKLKEILSHQSRCLIFYNFEPERDMIEVVAAELGFAIDTYCGDLKTLNNYNSDHKKYVIIAHVKSAGTGLNLQKLNNTIWFSLPNTFNEFDQANHRTYRLGQQSKLVKYYVLYTPFTVESRILDSLYKRKDYTIKLFEMDNWR